MDRMASKVTDKRAASSVFKYPEPIIVTPKLEHCQSIIILHGRGSTAQRFGIQGCPDKSGIFREPIISTTTSSSETLQSAFPHAKIIFPTASRTHATIYGKLTNQWFDNWHLEERQVKNELMIEGLRNSVEYVHGLLRKEIETVGKENVVLWGLSQGCATNLASLLTWDGEPFAAVVGMCGWLPFDKLVGKFDLKYSTTPEASKEADMEMRDATEQLQGSSIEQQAAKQSHVPKLTACGHCNTEVESKSQLFKHLKLCDEIPECQHCEKTFPSKELLQEHHDADCPSYDPGLPPWGITLLRKKLGVGAKKGRTFQEIPVFLGHGTHDEIVGIELGREARRCLESVGVDVRAREYEGLEHWTSPEMMHDIFEFLKMKLGDGGFSSNSSTSFRYGTYRIVKHLENGE